MAPILSRYGPFFLYSYNVVLGLGLAAGLALTTWLERRGEDKRLEWLDGLLVALLAGLVGGRVPFVWANWAYFQGHPGEIVQVWRGGLNYHGVLLGGLVALWIWSRRQPFSFGRYAGLLAPALALVSAFGWAACWLEGCAYGRETVIGPLSADLPDSYGVYGLRYQTQLLGLVLSLATWLLALLFWQRLGPGRLFWLTLLLLSSGRALISLTRGDGMPMLGSFRLDTLLDASLSIVSLIGLMFAKPGLRSPVALAKGEPPTAPARNL